MILQLTRAIALAARDAAIPSSLATAAISAGNHVWDAGHGRGEWLVEVVGRVDLVGWCRLPFLMGVVARFFGEVCGVVMAEGEEGVGEMEALVWRFKREVENQIEEGVGTREFERVCGQLGVWESSDDDEEDFEDEDGVGRVCGEECESCVTGKEGYVAGADAAVGDEETDDDEGDGDHVPGAPPEDHTGEDKGDDDDSDLCSNPFEEDDQDTQKPTSIRTRDARSK